MSEPLEAGQAAPDALVGARHPGLRLWKITDAMLDAIPMVGANILATAVTPQVRLRAADLLARLHRDNVDLILRSLELEAAEHATEIGATRGAAMLGEIDALLAERVLRLRAEKAGRAENFVEVMNAGYRRLGLPEQPRLPPAE